MLRKKNVRKHSVDYRLVSAACPERMAGQPGQRDPESYAFVRCSLCTLWKIWYLALRCCHFSGFYSSVFYFFIYFCWITASVFRGYKYLMTSKRDSKVGKNVWSKTQIVSCLFFFFNPYLSPLETISMFKTFFLVSILCIC